MPEFDIQQSFAKIISLYSIAAPRGNGTPTPVLKFNRSQWELEFGSFKGSGGTQEAACNQVISLLKESAQKLFQSRSAGLKEAHDVLREYGCPWHDLDWVRPFLSPLDPI